MKYLIISVLILVGCNKTDECFEKNRPWNVYDYCSRISGTPQYNPIPRTK